MNLELQMVLSHQMRVLVLVTHSTSALNYQLAKSQNDNFKIEGTREMVKNMDLS